MRNLTDLLVHFLRRGSSLSHVYLSIPRDHCLVCEEEIRDSPLYVHLRVCPTCRFHYSLTARERIDLLVDRGSFRETNRTVKSLEPLTFANQAKDVPGAAMDQKRTGLTEGAVTGHCTLGGNKATIVILDFGFMGGTMGSIVGEKVALAFESSARGGWPVVAVVTGGGIRLQEGVLSLLQMAKTVTAAQHLREKGLPFIVVLANPATGQAYASFGNLADIILAEPGSLIGLAPMRTLREATRKPIPLDAHTAEAHLNHGLLDSVVDREELRDRLTTLLDILGPQRTSRTSNKKASKAKLPGHATEELTVLEAEETAHHANRPTARDYINAMVDHFTELKGDRLSGDDRTLIGGVGFLRGNRVVVLGQQRERRPGDERYHVYPEGFRKAQRLIQLAVRFKLPVVSLIDTQGAHPGLESEEQGMGNAIANTLYLMAEAPTPIVAAIIGEAGSEGALALGMADSVLMQEYALAVPVPFHVVGVRWRRDPARAREAALATMLTAHECKALGIVDRVVPEPVGGAHNDPLTAAQYLQLAVAREIGQLEGFSTKKLLERRQKKFRRVGELTPYAREALSREVSMLQSIVARGTSPRSPRVNQARTKEDESKAAD